MGRQADAFVALPGLASFFFCKSYVLINDMHSIYNYGRLINVWRYLTTKKI